MKPWVMRVHSVLIRLLESMRPQLYVVAKKMFPGYSFGIKESSIYIGRYHVRIIPSSKEGEFEIRFFLGDHEYASLFTTVELDLFGNYKEKDLKRVILDSLKTLKLFLKEETYFRGKNMKNCVIKEDVEIPGTNIVLEKNDRILYQANKLKESKLDDVKRKLKSFGFEDQGYDTWDNYEGTEVIIGDDSITISSEEDPYGGDEVSFSEFLKHPGEYLS